MIIFKKRNVKKKLNIMNYHPHTAWFPRLVRTQGNYNGSGGKIVLILPFGEKIYKRYEPSTKTWRWRTKEELVFLNAK